MALSEKKKQKLWIWKALCRDTGELIGWECRHRDKATLEKLIQRLEKWNVKVYYTDDWHPYRAVIPKDKLVQTKTLQKTIQITNQKVRLRLSYVFFVLIEYFILGDVQV